jgi:hypothetical protein
VKKVPGTVTSQQFEQHVSIPLHSAGIRIPVGPINDPLERADLEVILHVHREDVGWVG